MWAKGLHHPYRLGGHQRPARGQKSEMAMLPACGQRGYIIPAILGVPDAVLGSATLSAGTKPRNGCVGHMWAKWLHHPCRLGGLQRSARGQKSERAMWRTCGQSGYITPAILGVPNAVLGSATLSAGTKPRNGLVGHMWAKWLHHHCRLWDLQHLARGQKSEIAMWPRCGQTGYITPAALEVPNAQREDKNKKWRCGSHLGKVATSLNLRVPNA